ncbi:glycosyltransferase [Vibrio alginolyticus]|uniref:glycosyltransferase n=1 Tax=Vibrio alginolyticus TaxID=663 RepID=UPI0028F45585|nr:glycosyltransferase [Vibrio alginolyticus]WMN48322.1 glycosyltransferase [Vibrio alginolyticus]
MKVLAVIENISDEYGGPANSLPSLLHSLRKNNGLDSCIYSVKLKNDEKNTIIKQEGLNWKSYKLIGPRKLMFSPGLIWGVYKDIQSDDVIFSNNLWNFAAFASYALSRILKVQHIVSVRGSLYPWSLKQGAIRKKIIWKLFQFRALQNASFIHVTCKEEYDAVRSLGIDAPIEIIPHGVKYEDFQDLPDLLSATKELSLPEGKKFLLFISRLHKKKGLDLLLDVWPQIVAQHPDWCLVISGPDYENYSQKISKLIENESLSDSLVYTGMLSGWRKDCAFACANGFVLPSYTENFGVVIGEALAAGIPTITTHGTPWQDISTYDCGWYIETSRSNLIEAIKELISSSEGELALKGERGKKLIRDKYSWDSKSDSFFEVLNHYSL